MQSLKAGVVPYVGLTCALTKSPIRLLSETVSPLCGVVWLALHSGQVVCSGEERTAEHCAHCANFFLGLRPGCWFTPSEPSAIFS